MKKVKIHTKIRKATTRPRIILNEQFGLKSFLTIQQRKFSLCLRLMCHWPTHHTSVNQ